MLARLLHEHVVSRLQRLEPGVCLLQLFFELFSVFLRLIALVAQRLELALRLLAAGAALFYFLTQLRDIAVDIVFVKSAQTGAKHAFLLQTARHPFAKNAAFCAVFYQYIRSFVKKQRRLPRGPEQRPLALKTTRRNLLF